MGALVHKLKQLLQQLPADDFRSLLMDDGATTPELSALGLRIGDRVMVGGVKVSSAAWLWRC